MKGACHCGAVTIELPSAPDYLNECNCTLCWKLGTMWGYFAASEVRVTGAPRAYRRDGMNAEFCETCGAVTNWRITRADAPDRIGINMKLFDPAGLRGIELRFGDRRNHDFEPRHYYREPAIFDGAGAEP